MTGHWHRAYSKFKNAKVKKIYQNQKLTKHFPACPPPGTALSTSGEQPSPRRKFFEFSNSAFDSPPASARAFSPSFSLSSSHSVSVLGRVCTHAPLRSQQQKEGGEKKQKVTRSKSAGVCVCARGVKKSKSDCKIRINRGEDCGSFPFGEAAPCQKWLEESG